MSQRDLNRQISKATGEDIATIAGLGFVELRPIPFEREPLTEPLTIDWDQIDLDRNVAVIPQRRRKAAA